jgi:hypothetical protein
MVWAHPCAFHFSWPTSLDTTILYYCWSPPTSGTTIPVRHHQVNKMNISPLLTTNFAQRCSSSRLSGLSPACSEAYHFTHLPFLMLRRDTTENDDVNKLPSPHLRLVSWADASSRFLHSCSVPVRYHFVQIRDIMHVMNHTFISFRSPKVHHPLPPC